MESCTSSARVYRTKEWRSLVHIRATTLDSLSFTPLPYFIVLSIPLVIAMEHFYRTPFLTFLYAFFVIPAVDTLIGVDKANPTPEKTSTLSRDSSFQLLGYLCVSVQVALIVWGGSVVTSPDVSWSRAFALAVAIGLHNGGIGITVAHENLHKGSWHERLASRILLVTVSYGHFFIEHLHHHKTVGTRFDPATARLGESFPRFYVRTVPQQFLSAWRIEADRLRTKGHALLSVYNQILWYLGISLSFAMGLAYAFGITALFFFVVQSWVAFSLLEVINYVEHYGLQRKLREPGLDDLPKNYEKVQPYHSWNADNRLTNYFLFKLQRHSDHHANPMRYYQVLRSFEEAPQLPTGYPLMALMALLPPLFFRVMDPLVREHRKCREKVA